MKILLVFVPALVRNNKFEVLNSPPLALYVLSACVKKAGYEVEIIDPCEFLIFDKKDNLVEKTYKFICSRMESCDVIAFSSNTFNWGITKEILDSIINDKKSKRIILGGLHPTIFDKHVLESTCADYVIRGEGEKTLPHLLDAINHKQDVESIPGITYKIDGVIYRNEDAKPLTVDEWKAMPYPDYSLLPINNPYLYIPVESSRGCHFNCAFCSIPHRHNWRALPAEEVVDRVKYALKETATSIPIKSVLFVDDCYTNDPQRVREIRNNYSKEINPNIPIGIEVRATDIIKGDFIQNSNRNEFSFIQIGVECGYDEGLKRIRKGLRMEQLYKALDILSDKGYQEMAFLSFIIGFPWESKDEIIMTLNSVENIAEKYNIICNVNWLMMLPSSIWEEREKYNISIDESVFDDKSWSYDEDVFFKTHPNLNISLMKYAFEKVKNMRLRGLKINLNMPDIKSVFEVIFEMKYVR